MKQQLKNIIKTTAAIRKDLDTIDKIVNNYSGKTKEEFNDLRYRLGLSIAIASVKTVQLNKEFELQVNTLSEDATDMSLKLD